jgi:hypothetical protein
VRGTKVLDEFDTGKLVGIASVMVDRVVVAIEEPVVRTRVLLEGLA